jgi:hypothetical protein
VPATQAAAALAPGRRVRLGSPWSPGLTANVIAADWMGANDLFPVTREQAMKVPAVASARDIICTTLAQGALRLYRGEGLAATQPQWMYRTDSEVAPQVRALWTWDDLFFSGFSLWQTFRSSAGAIGDAVRVPYEAWDWDEDFNVLIDGDLVNARDVILFSGWNEGMLLLASDTIKQSLAISAAVTSRVNNPVPHTLIREASEQYQRTDEEAQKFTEDFAAARRRAITSPTSYVPYGTEIEAFGTADIGLYEQGRNAGVLDIARHAGVPASLLEANSVSASLTYETQEANRAILNDRLRARALFMESRLSLDDVCPRGTRVALDLSHLTGPDDGLPASTED